MSKIQNVESQYVESRNVDKWEMSKVNISKCRMVTYTSYSGPDRIIVYATEANLQEDQLWIVDSRHWFMDGTFKTTPPFFAQVYTDSCFEKRTSTTNGVRYAARQYSGYLWTSFSVCTSE